jgi:hypothetical protein
MSAQKDADVLRQKDIDGFVYDMSSVDALLQLEPLFSLSGRKKCVGRYP